jgi:hypothetical protein
MAKLTHALRHVRPRLLPGLVAAFVKETAPAELREKSVFIFKSLRLNTLMGTMPCHGFFTVSCHGFDVLIDHFVLQLPNLQANYFCENWRNTMFFLLYTPRMNRLPPLSRLLRV